MSLFVAAAVGFGSRLSRSTYANGQRDVSAAVMIGRGRLTAVVKSLLADIHIIIHSHWHSTYRSLVKPGNNTPSLPLPKSIIGSP
jgi:hypothetical protein